MDRLVVLAGAPTGAFALLAALPATRAVAHRALRYHLAILICVYALYCRLKARFARNLRVPPRDPLDSRCRVYRHGGMEMLLYVPPRRPRGAILLCPGVSTCVRRSLRHAFVAPFHADRLILCFQPRGLGASSPAYDITAESVFTDARCALTQLAAFRVPHTDVLGFSMGSFVAAQLLARGGLGADARCILVAAMFDASTLPLAFRVSARVLGFRNDAVTGRVRNRTCIVHSADDEITAESEAAAHAAERRELGLPTAYVRVRGRHSDYRLEAAHGAALRAFLARDRVDARRARN